MSFRKWLSVATVVLLAVVVFFAWPDLVRAWGLIEKVNIWILLLLVPVQLFSYYATGSMIFSYLRSKGNLKDVSHVEMTRMSLELNFVNHILPSGGAAGFSYLGWRLGRHGVTAGRATAAQLIRFTMTFLSFILLLLVAVIILAADHHINRTILLLCGMLAVVAIGGTGFIIYIISSRENLLRFSAALTRFVNKTVKFFTRGRKKRVLKPKMLEKFFMDLHQDYVEIKREKRILIVPFIWALLANVADVALLLIAFWSLGEIVNPAALFIAFGLSSLAGGASAIPGGAGVYETVMIAFLASSGIAAGLAIAGTLLARVVLVLGTIVFGYIFYQLTINKYGKHPS